MTPLDVMLRTMRALLEEAEAAAKTGEPVPDSGLAPDLTLLIEASKVAKDAAPYMHPRLQSTTLKGDKDNPLMPSLTFPSAEELRKFVRGE